MFDGHDLRKPRDVWADICYNRRTVMPVNLSIRGVDNSHGGSSIPRLGVTEKGSDDHGG